MNINTRTLSMIMLIMTGLITPALAAETPTGETMKIKGDTLKKAATFNQALSDADTMLAAIKLAGRAGIVIEAPGPRPPAIIFTPQDKDWNAILDLARNAAIKKRQEAVDGLKSIGVEVEN